jgi:Flp pilus assembly pilin Flp
MRSLMRRRRLGLAGATAIEYAMIAFFISIAVFSAVMTVGTTVSNIFAQVATSF